MMFGFGSNQNRQPQRPASYSDVLQIIPAYAFERQNLEAGNKVLLPPSVLNLLMQNHDQIPSPMLFSIMNTKSNKKTHVGVQEFVAPEGTIVLPFWIFSMLNCIEGQQIIINYVPELTDIKGTFIKIQPHKTKFIEIKDPKAVLEVQLRNYQCLTQGDTINVIFQNVEYKINILSIEGVGGKHTKHNAICVVNSNINTEFEEPLDYVEPEKKEIDWKNQDIKKISAMFEEKKRKSSNNEFAGNFTTIDGKLTKKQMITFIEEDIKKEKKVADSVYDPRKHRIQFGIRKNQDQKEQEKLFKGKNIKIKNA